MANLVETELRITGLDKAQRDIEAYKKSLGTIGNPSSKGQADLSMQKALRDIQRYQQQQINFERQLTRQVEREAEQQYRARVRSIQRANQEALKLLNQSNAQNQGANLFSPLFGSFGRVGSIGQSIAGGAAVGGGIGVGIALAAEAISIAKDLGLAMADVAKKATLVAANLQQTTASLAAFTGSAGIAKAELKAINELARTTPGLDLLGARTGYQRLRASGFSEEIARNLTKEIGEEKILSGADNDAVQRVLFNFTQIYSGGQKIGQEIRELLTAMPTLKRSFEEAFGTINGAQLQQLFDKDPDAFFRKLIETMAKGPQVAGGLNDALQKLSDQGTRLQEIFGEPILEPLTDGVRNLTEFLRENEFAFRELGVGVGETIRVINDSFEALTRGYDSMPEPLKMLIYANVRATTGFLTGGLSELGRFVPRGASASAGLNNDIRKNKDRFEGVELYGGVNLEELKEQRDLEKEIAENRKKAQDAIRDAATRLGEASGNPFVKFYLEADKSLRDFNENFKYATAEQRNQFKALIEEIKLTAIAVQELQNKTKARDLRNKAFDLTGLLLSETGGRPKRLGFLGDALAAITGAAGLRRQIAEDTGLLFGFAGNATLSQVQGYGSGASRIDDIARRFGNLGIQGQALVAQSKLSLLPSSQELAALGGRFGSYGLFERIKLNEVLAKAEDEKLSNTLFKNDFFGKQLKRYEQDLVEAQRVVAAGGRVPLGSRIDNLLNTYDQIGTENLNAKQLQEYAQALELRATETEREKELARRFYENMNALIDETGLKVRLAETAATITIINESNGRARHDLRGKPSNVSERYNQ